MAWTPFNFFKYDPGTHDFDKTTFNIKQALNNNWDHVKTLIEEVREKRGNTQTLRFENVSVPVSAWTADTVFEEFPFRAVISLAGVTPDWICKTITPDYTDRSLDFLFCPYVSTGTGNLSIWAREIPDHEIVFENICCEEVLDNVQ